MSALIDSLLYTLIREEPVHFKKCRHFAVTLPSLFVRVYQAQMAF